MTKTMRKLITGFVFFLAFASLHAQIVDDELEEKELRDIQSGDSPLRGTITLRGTIGFYNYTNSYYYEDDHSHTRDYTFNWYIGGGELAIRMGRDSNLFHYSQDKKGKYKTGFTYYRSNRGIFIDMETGFKTFGDLPTFYTVKDNKRNVNETVILGDASTDIDGVTVTYENLVNGDVDDISSENRTKYGAYSSRVYMYYMNNYYHLTPLNMLLNFGKKFRWYDGSLGLSIRVASYTDYSDPERMLVYQDDATIAYYALVYRQYVQLHPRVRWRWHQYWSFVGTAARAAKEKGYNQEEHMFDTAFDIYIMPYLYTTIGYEQHTWVGNPSASDRFNRSTGSNFANGLRDGLVFDDRTSNEFYVGVALELPVTRQNQ